MVVGGNLFKFRLRFKKKRTFKKKRAAVLLFKKSPSFESGNSCRGGPVSERPFGLRSKKALSVTLPEWLKKNIRLNPLSFFFQLLGTAWGFLGKKESAVQRG